MNANLIYLNLVEDHFKHDPTSSLSTSCSIPSVGIFVEAP